MSDYAIIFQILGVLCALFFIFLTVMNFKSWRWLHALTTFALFCAVITFMVYASLVMKTRLAWGESHAKFTEANRKQADNHNKVLVGNPGDRESVETSLTYYRSELARALVDRGRIWRNCTPAVNMDGSVTLTMNLNAAPPIPAAGPTAPAAPAPAAPAAPAVVKTHQLKVNDIVFAFKEAATPEGFTLPVHYVSEFVVTAATEANITLGMIPTFIRPPVQADEVNATWMLYEVLPPDAHEPFADPKDKKKALPQDVLTKIGIPPTVATSYARDNGPGNPDDPADNTWVQVKFLKSHEIVVDASAMQSPVESGHFDAQGQAQIPGLARSVDPKTPDPVKFAPGDIAIFDTKTANDLIAANIVERQGLIYRRQLNDYEQAFQVISRKLYVLRERAAMVTRDTETINAAITKALAQTKMQEAEKILLDADKAKVVYERDVIKKYADALAAQIKANRAEMRRQYQANKDMYAEIAEINRRLTEEVERNLTEATASVEKKK